MQEKEAAKPAFDPSASGGPAWSFNSGGDDPAPEPAPPTVQLLVRPALTGDAAAAMLARVVFTYGGQPPVWMHPDAARELAHGIFVAAALAEQEASMFAFFTSVAGPERAMQMQKQFAAWRERQQIMRLACEALKDVERGPGHA